VTTYYLSAKAGLNIPGLNAVVTEATSSPTADVTVVLGANNPIANVSRSWVLEQLKAIIAYINGDDPKLNGAGVLPFLNN
jgi:hypothetical protein